MTLEVTLRALVQTDLGLLFHWLNAPHLVPFYMQERIGREAIKTKFTPRITKDHAVACVIAQADGQPFGYTQWYLNRSFPDWGLATIGRPDGVSIDYYIGDPNFLGRGLVAVMLRHLVDQTLPSLAKDDQHAFIGHDLKNARAIRCTTDAGFLPAGDFSDAGKASRLFQKTHRS